VKKSCLVLFLGAAFSCAMARADTIDIVFDRPLQTGSPGDTLQFFGTLTNASSDTVFLNSDGFSLAGLPIIDMFGNTPLSLDPGTNSGDIELFDVAIPNAFPASSNDGTYTLEGGAPGEFNIIGTADFTVNVAGVSTVPEPSYRLFLILGIALLMATRKIVRFAFTT
jgi:hypothetical protein